MPEVHALCFVCVMDRLWGWVRFHVPLCLALRQAFATVPQKQVGLSDLFFHLHSLKKRKKKLKLPGFFQDAGPRMPEF
uniref:Uncharacterized protein n=1 Tax=Anguilla anguilla TaxID=7936 RepID=A0A0E9X2S0_ANGAN